MNCQQSAETQLQTFGKKKNIFNKSNNYNHNFEPDLNQRVMWPCRRMRRRTSYLPCLSRSLCWSRTSCCLLRTRTTSRKDWQRSSRSSRTLCSPYRTWSPTTTLTPSRSKSKIWLAGHGHRRDNQVQPLKKWTIILTLPFSCNYYRITFIQVREKREHCHCEYISSWPNPNH